jgi:hypothetical protein
VSPIRSAGRSPEPFRGLPLPSLSTPPPASLSFSPCRFPLIRPPSPRIVVISVHSPSCRLRCPQTCTTCDTTNAAPRPADGTPRRYIVPPIPLPARRASPPAPETPRPTRPLAGRRLPPPTRLPKPGCRHHAGRGRFAAIQNNLPCRADPSRGPTASRRAAPSHKKIQAGTDLSQLGHCRSLIWPGLTPVTRAAGF